MRLPPLNALRTFEAAARHLSFKAAAAELHVTTAAVSHQIRALEEELGMALFFRRHRQVALTVEGERYLPGVRAAFAGLRDCTERLCGLKSATIKLAVRHALCQRWLLPRLDTFLCANPSLTLEIENEVDRDYPSYDVILDYRPAPADGYHSQLILEGPLIAVGSLEYIAKLGIEPEWEQVRLLHDRPFQGMHDYPDWPSWFTSLGLASPTQTTPLRFSTSNMCIEAAAAGLGLALVPKVAIAHELASGRLCQLGQYQAGWMRFYLVYTEAAMARPEVRILVNWLQAHACISTATDPDISSYNRPFCPL